MDIKPTSHLVPSSVSGVSKTTQNAVSTELPANWTVASQVKAIVDKIVGTQLLLNIQGIKATAEKPPALEIRPGDTLNLQIMQLKPLPQFKVASVQQAPSNTVMQQVSYLLAATQTSLQNINKPMANLLQNIAFVANRPALQPSPMKAEINTVLKQVFNNLPAPHNLKSATQLKLHLLNSGTFLENKMRNFIEHMPSSASLSNTRTENIAPPVNHDLRVQLHRLANILRQHIQPDTAQQMPGRPAPHSPTESAQTYTPVSQHLNQQQPKQPAAQQAETSMMNRNLATVSQRDEAMLTVLRQVESSLNQIQQNQAQTLSDSTPARPTWLMDVPVRNGQDIDLFELKIEEDQEGKEAEDINKIWRVTLTFDLTGLGKVTSYITLVNDEVSAVFATENTDTLTLFNQHFELLKSRLSSSGMSVGQIETKFTTGESNE